MTRLDNMLLERTADMHDLSIAPLCRRLQM